MPFRKVGSERHNISIVRFSFVVAMRPHRGCPQAHVSFDLRLLRMGRKRNQENRGTHRNSKLTRHKTCTSGQWGSNAPGIAHLSLNTAQTENKRLKRLGRIAPAMSANPFSGRQLEGKSSGELDVAGTIYRKLRHTEEGIVRFIETAVTVSWRCEDMPVKGVQEFTL